MPRPGAAVKRGLRVEARLVDVNRTAHQSLDRLQPAGMPRETTEGLIEAVCAVNHSDDV